ncbi:MAG: 50S ribosomal protein L11 methyltransferase [Deltaproteobacteria bacterium]|nr:50S ribosomal protein L11 methyltransferase [Deltaproteobacteria bacterium]
MTIEGWTAIEIKLPLEVQPTDTELDVMSGVLFEIGAQGIELRDAERPMMVIAAFSPEFGSASLRHSVSAALEDAGLPFSHVDQRGYEPIDWSTHWRSHFHPMDFGKLWVVPSWLEAPAEAGHVLWIDPSRAFGTGLHATTGLCLRAVLDRSPTSSILDVGTGTGILAFGALKLGTAHAVGVDNDPEALDVATENAQYNGLSDRVELRATLPDGVMFPLVVANILAGPLIEMAPEISACVAPGGVLLLSGILGTQVDGVVAAYRNPPLSFDVLTVAHEGEWARIDLQKRAGHG